MNRTCMRALLLVLLSAGVTDALACGEVMYRMGGALHYRAFVTRHPAQILLYSAASSANLRTDTQAFHRNLEKAGHKVTLIDGPQALAQALAQHRYDVVIAFAADLPDITAEIGRTAQEPVLIPVIEAGGDARRLREQYPLAQKEDANLNQFLKVIEHSMNARGS